MRYLHSASEMPLASDYYYEATQITNDHFPVFPSHTHDYYEIYIFQSGSVKVSVENHIFNVKQGDIIVIPPFTIHQLHPINPNQMYQRIFMHITIPCLASFQFNQYSLLSPLQMAIKEKHYHFHVSDENEYNRIVDAMFQIYRSKTENYFGKEMLNRSRILEIMTLINKYIIMDITPHKTTHVNPVIEEILAYVNEHYNEPLTLNDISNQFFINKFTLTKLFKKQTALTFHNYVVLKRISMAKQKIMEGVLPSEVYYQVGFNDYSTFYRCFEKTEGISPKEFSSRNR